MPYTKHLPKCLLTVDGDRSALEFQLRALVDCGITEARVMVGFQADKVETFLATDPVPGINVTTFFNPFFDSSENIVTAWLASLDMKSDFLLMNGDTLFEADVLRRLLDAPKAPITLVVNGKPEYDDDDMKVSVGAGGRLLAVSKTLSGSGVNGESIGLMRFAGAGVEAFRSAIDRAVRTQRGIGAYYLSVIDQLSREIPVETAFITGLWWGEMDSPEDLASVRAEIAERQIGKDDRVVALKDSQPADLAHDQASDDSSQRTSRPPKRRTAAAGRNIVP